MPNHMIAIWSAAALLALVLLVWFGLSHAFRKVSIESAHESVLVDGERADVLTSLAEHIYGPEPAPLTPRVLSREAIAPERAGGVQGVEQWQIDLGEAGRFNLVLVLPEQRPAPLILMQTFCGNRAAFPGRPEAIAAPLQWYPWICKESWLDAPLRGVFGEHIAVPPYELIREAGFALAVFYGGDVVPDHSTEARRALERFGADVGALSAWAWAHSRALDVLAEDERIDAARVAVWGQSRQGKVALLTGARDERFAAVVALQSGRGGDAPTSHRAGESVPAITTQFPHWFTPRFRTYARADPPVDQQDLLALIAPRPLLIGHAWNDGWADPAGAHAAAKAATPAWTRSDAEAPRLFVRDGRHGIVRRDWEETLAFLNSAFAAQR